MGAGGVDCAATAVYEQQHFVELAAATRRCAVSANSRMRLVLWQMASGGGRSNRAVYQHPCVEILHSMLASLVTGDQNGHETSRKLEVHHNYRKQLWL